MHQRRQTTVFHSSPSQHIIAAVTLQKAQCSRLPVGQNNSTSLVAARIQTTRPPLAAGWLTPPTAFAASQKSRNVWTRPVPATRNYCRLNLDFDCQQMFEGKTLTIQKYWEAQSPTGLQYAAIPALNRMYVQTWKACSLSHPTTAWNNRFCETYKLFTSQPTYHGKHGLQWSTWNRHLLSSRIHPLIQTEEQAPLGMRWTPVLGSITPVEHTHQRTPRAPSTREFKSQSASTSSPKIQCTHIKTYQGFGETEGQIFQSTDGVVPSLGNKRAVFKGQNEAARGETCRLTATNAYVADCLPWSRAAMCAGVRDRNLQK